MSGMPEMKRVFLSIMVGVLLLCIPAMQAFGGSIHEIRTGPENSASWQFTENLSLLWGQKHRDKESFFKPSYQESIHQRFIALDRHDCKAIIAPLKSVTDLPITDLGVKIAVVLWESYVAPVVWHENPEEVGLFNYRNWYTQEGAGMIPFFVKRMVSGYNNSPRMLNETALSLLFSIDLSDKEYKPGYPLRKEFAEPDASRGEESGNVYLSDLPDFSIHYPKIRITELNREGIIDTVSANEPGILFFEMIGPASSLEDALALSTGRSAKIIGMQWELIEQLRKYHPLLETFRFSVSNVNTVSITYALFVHEEEDEEFVKALIETLTDPPRTYFPRPYLLNHLKLNETKEISPLFLHKASIEFFDIY